MKHRIYTDINDAIDVNSGPFLQHLKPHLLIFVSNPLLVSFLVLILLIAVIVVHAYFDTLQPQPETARALEQLVLQPVSVPVPPVVQEEEEPVAQLRIKTLHRIITPTNIPSLHRTFIQITVGCGNEVPLHNCRGQLLRVLRWSTHTNDWEPTEIDELLDLFWSNVDQESVTIEPNADRRLNIFFAQSDRIIVPRVGPLPMRFVLHYAPGRIFRFDVRIAADGATAEHRSVRVIFGQEWDDIVYEEVPAAVQPN